MKYSNKYNYMKLHLKNMCLLYVKSDIVIISVKLQLKYLYKE
jgi:hypothetical protein